MWRCTQQLTCSSCKGNHPTPLHGYTPNKKSKTDGNQTVDGGENLKNNFAGFNNDLKCASMTGKTGDQYVHCSSDGETWGWQKLRQCRTIAVKGPLFMIPWLRNLETMA